MNGRLLSTACTLLVGMTLGCGEDCGRLVVPSVWVVVVDSSGEAVTDASVAYQTESQGEGECGLEGSRYLCGYEVSGEITVVVARDDATGRGVVEVPRGECNVRTQTLEVQLSDDAG